MGTNWARQAREAAERAESIDILIQLLESLRRPDAVHPALAALVAARARALLQDILPPSVVRGYASQGRMTAIEGPPASASRSQRLPLL